ncbi:MAG: DUF3149 domain-containing protein [Limisphaerales bacterium]
MNSKILLLLTVWLLSLISLANAQQSPIKIPNVDTNPPAIAIPSQPTNPPFVALQGVDGGVKPQVPPLSPSMPQIALPADIASLTAKEILSANNQVVGQIATMYQHFGLFITIIVTMLGIIATVVGYFIRKSVHELVGEWTKKFEKIEAEMEKSRNRLLAAVNEAEGSAKDAAASAESIDDDKKVLSQAIKDVDRLRERVIAMGPIPQNPPGAIPNSQNQPPIAPIESGVTGITQEESAEVRAFLDDKLGKYPENPGAKS